MLINDIGIICLLGTFIGNAYHYIILASKNTAEHAKDPIVQQHFSEHAFACMFAFLFGSSAFAFSVLHLVYQNFSNIVLPMWLEIGQTVSYGGLILVGILFIVHMRREETVGHPFFIREYGDKENK